MLKIQHLKIKGFETVVVGKDPSAHFHAIIAVHSTRLGPSLGGIRMWPYKNEKEALRDVLRLAQAMSKKAIKGENAAGGFFQHSLNTFFARASRLSLAQ